MATGPLWCDHAQDGVTYSVRHLHPHFVEHEIPAIPCTRGRRGRAASMVKVRVLYSHHCFTQALAKAPLAIRHHGYVCTRRRNDHRVFCLLRWKQSLALPSIIAAITHCWFTRHHNFFVWRDPDDASCDPYFVYFSVARRTGYVELEVESAYTRADAREARIGARKLSLATLIANTAQGRGTHRPIA